MSAFGGFLCLALLIYWPALPGPYLWDDSAMLRAGRGSGGLQTVWTGGLVDYLPVTSTVLWAGWHIWGDHPLGFRLLNVALHAANATLVLEILRKLKCPGAWIAAALFCVHPVCAGTVAWIAEIKNTLSLFFSLLAIWFFLRASEGLAPQNSGLPGRIRTTGSPVTRDYVLAVLGFLLALLSKISVVTLPFVLAGLDYWRTEASGSCEKTSQAASPQASPPANSGAPAVQKAGLALLRTSPFFLLSLILGLVNVWFQEHHAMSATAASHAEPMLTRLLSGGLALWFYLWKTLLPMNLMPIYPGWKINPKSLAAWTPGILWLGTLAACWHFWHFSRLKQLRLRRMFRAAFFGLAFFSVTLVPVLGLLQISYFYISPVADHLDYLPMLGVLAAVGYAFAAWAGESRERKFFRAIPGGAILVLACATWQRADLFGHPERLWRENLARNPRAAMAWTNLGDVEAGQGRSAEAYDAYSQSLALDPGNLAVRAIFARLLVVMERFDEAIAQYREVLKYLPSDANAHNNLGITLARKRLYAEAIVEFKTALALAPDFADARKNLGGAYYTTGQYDAAIEELKRVPPSSPSFTLAQQILQDAQRRKQEK